MKGTAEFMEKDEKFKKQLGSECETGVRKSRGKRVGEQLDMCESLWVVDCILMPRLMNMEPMEEFSKVKY